MKSMIRLTQEWYVADREFANSFSVYLCLLLQSNGYDRLNFFKEADTYWAPAATAEDLYTQLSEYKYREISRKEIRLVLE